MKILVVLVCLGSVWAKFMVLSGNVDSLGMPLFRDVRKGYGGG